MPNEYRGFAMGSLGARVYGDKRVLIGHQMTSESDVGPTKMEVETMLDVDTAREFCTLLLAIIDHFEKDGWA